MNIGIVQEDLLIIRVSIDRAINFWCHVERNIPNFKIKCPSKLDDKKAHGTRIINIDNLLIEKQNCNIYLYFWVQSCYKHWDECEIKLIIMMQSLFLLWNLEIYIILCFNK